MENLGRDELLPVSVESSSTTSDPPLSMTVSKQKFAGGAAAASAASKRQRNDQRSGVPAQAVQVRVVAGSVISSLVGAPAAFAPAPRRVLLNAAGDVWYCAARSSRLGAQERLAEPAGRSGCLSSPARAARVEKDNSGVHVTVNTAQPAPSGSEPRQIQNAAAAFRSSVRAALCAVAAASSDGEWKRYCDEEVQALLSMRVKETDAAHKSLNAARKEAGTARRVPTALRKQLTTVAGEINKRFKDIIYSDPFGGPPDLGSISPSAIRSCSTATGPTRACRDHGRWYRN
jgi:hypothetical protein